MPVSKFKALNTADLVKPEEGNDSQDTFIRHKFGREPFLSFPWSDSPMPWIQLLHALNQKGQDIPDWPLLTPYKVQMQKCDKCSREFYSSINKKRHVRVQHRLKKLDKDSSKFRDLLGTFWDKLSEDAMQEILSFKDVKLEDAIKEMLLFKDVKLKEGTGSSIVNSLTNLLQKPGFSSLSQPPYMHAGSTLLDIIQAMPSKFPLSSKELFGILDDASENTFLCGKAISMQKYVFDGEIGKIGEAKNLVAFTSFLVEHKLVKAWLADKDAEALRCQKLLMEEEEAAQKSLAELLERKRQKKLWQKEQRAKEQGEEKKADINKRFDDNVEAVSIVEQSCPFATSDSDIHGRDTLPDHLASPLAPFQLSDVDKDLVLEIQAGAGSGCIDKTNNHKVKLQTMQGGSHRHNVVPQWQMPPTSQRNHLPFGFHLIHNTPVAKLSIMQKHGSPRDLKPFPMVNGNRKWSRRPKAECNGESFRNGVHRETIQPDHDKKREVLIGSICVTIGNNRCHNGCNLDASQDNCLVEHQMPKKKNLNCLVEHQMPKKKNLQGKHIRPDSGQCCTNHAMVKLWRPVSQRGTTKGTMSVQNETCESQVDGIADEGDDQTLYTDSCLKSSVVDDNCGEKGNSSLLLEENVYTGSSQFSTEAARVFLAERWKEAIAAEHVKLVIHQNLEQPGCAGVCQVAEDIQTSSLRENQFINGVVHESTVGAGKVKFKTKPEKGVKVQYIPKQKTIIT